MGRGGALGFLRCGCEGGVGGVRVRWVGGEVLGASL